LAQYIRFEHSICGAEWLEEEGKWKLLVKGPDGQVKEDICDVFLNAGGVLKYGNPEINPQICYFQETNIANSNFRYPNIEGLWTFKGKLMHTANWDNEYDLKDKRVAVIGAGSSGAQVIPSILPRVKKLHSFVKSPTWITAGFAQRFAGPDGGNFSCR